MTIPTAVVSLVERFSRNVETYKRSEYNETQLRREFLDPLFEALGWDLTNKLGYADAYKDVIHEDSIKVEGVGGGTKAPDYCFRIGGTRKFFLEAKKPFIDIKGDPDPAYQLRRYAWSGKLPISVLSDFEEFAIYDTRIKPNHKDKSSSARIFYCTYDEYAKKWEEIASILSKEAVLTGSFDKYAESAKGKSGTAEVDDEFLAEIEKWRVQLAVNIALRNPQIDERDLNVAVTKTIDRIVFLRICEDRGIEIQGQLQEIAKAQNIYEDLLKLFHRADEKYNSGLFHFTKEKDRAQEPDTLTPTLHIDNKTLSPILNSLYYPCPYVFSVLPADILGQVYEQFLGKVITLTEKHRAKVDEKPEVRKAGGVYYTPTYIVQCIVQNTVEKLIEQKTPKEVSKLKILDPACGSGSFLLGAFQHLLDWHLEYYSGNPDDFLKQRQPPIYRIAAKADQSAPVFRLTTNEKKRILLNNIYGVDIDQNAVETTKLSLLLKVLEDESSESLANQMKLFHGERALPDLVNNIQCGNSLIESDFYRNEQLSLLEDDKSKYLINAFDWEVKFQSIMQAGKFDIVIGNPPYFNMDDTWGNNDPKQKYIKQKFAHIYNDKTDILFYFLAKAVSLAKSEVGFIVSRAFFEAYKADKLRGWLTANSTVREIVDFRNFSVFSGVGITTALVFLTHKPDSKKCAVRRLMSEQLNSNELLKVVPATKDFEYISINSDSLGAGPWIFAPADSQKLLSKIDKAGKPLSQFLKIGQGMQTGCNKVFGSKTVAQVRSLGLREHQYYMRARNSDIQRYRVEESGEVLLYLEDVSSFGDLPMKMQTYLQENSKPLRKRAAFKRKNCDWWKYTWPLHKEDIGKSKLLCPYLAQENRFALDTEQIFLGLTDTTILYENGQPEDIRYLMALLNSRLLTFRFRFIGKLKSNDIIEYFWNSISKIPIRPIDFQDEEDKAVHDRLVKLVNIMLTLQRQLAKARSGREQIQRQIYDTDKQIDTLVCDLYGLSPEEVQLVEEKVKRE